MTKARWNHLFDELLEDKYFQGDSLPAGGLVVKYEVLHKHMVGKDPGWALHPESTHGKREAEGLYPYQGGYFIQERVRLCSFEPRSHFPVIADNIPGPSVSSPLPRPFCGLASADGP